MGYYNVLTKTKGRIYQMRDKLKKLLEQAYKTLPTLWGVLWLAIITGASFGVFIVVCRWLLRLTGVVA
jgi:hypothetical protein